MKANFRRRYRIATRAAAPPHRRAGRIGTFATPAAQFGGVADNY
jgi:hypothetical protein